MQTATQRISADLTRRGFVAGVTASLATLGLFKSAKAAPEANSRAILFTNVRLFDGTSNNLRDGVYLLVEGNRIKDIGTGTPATPEGGRAINCGGRVIMPGLIDMHWHAMFAGLSLPILLQGDPWYISLTAAEEAERTLMRGFTTIRDLGGPSFALKQGIDQGLATGPRIYPCGAMITSSGGHGDMRPVYELPAAPGGPFGSVRAAEGAMVADGPVNVMVRVREQLLQ
ncbi:MAG TPA: amidohydrolase family protein, partial [Xanthobacteraceae bacterium]